MLLLCFFFGDVWCLHPLNPLTLKIHRPHCSTFRCVIHYALDSGSKISEHVKFWTVVFIKLFLLYPLGGVFVSWESPQRDKPL